MVLQNFHFQDTLFARVLLLFKTFGGIHVKRLFFERLEKRFCCTAEPLLFEIPELPFTDVDSNVSVEITPNEPISVFRQSGFEMHAGGPVRYVFELAVYAEGDITAIANLKIETRINVAAQVPISHNWRYPADVDGDGTATAKDSLIVVNGLNYSGLGDGTVKPDVNGDGKLSPLDVLLAVNVCNGSFFASPFANVTKSREMLVSLEIISFGNSDQPANIVWILTEELSGPDEKEMRFESSGIASMVPDQADDMTVFSLESAFNGTSGPSGFSLIRDSTTKAILSTKTGHYVDQFMSVNESAVINGITIVDGTTSAIGIFDLRNLASPQYGSLETETSGVFQLDMLLDRNIGSLAADAIGRAAAGAAGIINGEVYFSTAAMDDLRENSLQFNGPFSDSLHSGADFQLDPL